MFASFLVCGAVFSRAGFLPHLNERASRVAHLDGLRGIAAILVVCAHIKWLKYVMPADRETYQFVYACHTNMGSLGVQIFFCITGFLFFGQIMKADGRLDWVAFYRSRIKRVVPVYVFWAVISLATIVAYSDWGALDLRSVPEALKIFGFGFSGNSFTIGGLNTGTVTAIIWTLAVEWKFYFLVPFIAAIYTNKKLFGTSVAILWAYLFIGLLSSDSGFALYFLTGFLAAYLYRNIDVTSTATSVAFGVIALLCGALSIYLDLPQFGWIRYVLASVLFLSVLLSRSSIFSCRPLVYLGEISYSVYLFHLLILFLFQRNAEAYLQTVERTSPHFVAVTFVLAFLVVLVSSLTFRFVELPFLRKKAAGNPGGLESGARMVPQQG